MAWTLDMWAAMDVLRGKLLFLVSNEVEGEIQLKAGLGKATDADLANTGFDLLPVQVTVEIRPLPTDSLKHSRQRRLFSTEGEIHGRKETHDA